MKSRFYILVDNKFPVFVIDEDAQPVHFDSLETAREAAQRQTMARALGFTVLEWDDDGFVELY